MNKEFQLRGFNLCESLNRHTPEELTRFFRRMKTLDFNAVIIHYDYGFKRYRELIERECAEKGIDVTLMVFGPRTFFSLGGATPDMFACDESGNPWIGEAACETWPCFSNPEALECFRLGAVRFLKQLPHWVKRIHMRAGDGLLFCRCPKCRNLAPYNAWMPFVRAFMEAVQIAGVTIPAETDIYLNRYALPDDLSPLAECGTLMYDTFGRHQRIPLGDDPGIFTGNMDEIAGIDKTGFSSVSEYHARRLREWATALPGKFYIHENTMMQSQVGVFLHNTGAMLKDQALYRELGLQGVFYEAYEPGYSNFSRHFEILAAGLKNPEIRKSYEPTEIEKHLTNQDKFGFLDGITSPELLRMLPEETAEYMRLLEDVRWRTTPRSFQKAYEFAYERRDRLDHLYVGYMLARFGIRFGLLDFTQCAPEAREMMRHAKLWDYQEKLPLSTDPVRHTEERLFELCQNVR